MAFDGITVAALVAELNGTIRDGYISRIIQPERDSLLITVKTRSTSYLLHLSANASLPFAMLTEEKKTAPMTAPNFCMLLRKHLQGGQILSIEQPSLERVLRFTVRHHNEMGDEVTNTLVIELMGKHSNIILTNEEGTILDSIKRIPSSVSSVREVLPGRQYFIPNTEGKKDPLTTGKEDVKKILKSSKECADRAVLTSFTGISPVVASETVFEAGAEPRTPASELDDDTLDRIATSFEEIIDRVRTGNFDCLIYYKDQKPVEYSSVPLTIWQSSSATSVSFASVSEMLTSYFGQKEKYVRMHQKSQDLRQMISTLVSRTKKKQVIQQKQKKDTEGKDKYKLWGELITSYAYQIPQGDDHCECLNYYTGENVTIPLDPNKTPVENAQHYFAKYSKLKRTEEALAPLIIETDSLLDALLVLQINLEHAESEEELEDARKELETLGVARTRTDDKKEKIRKTHSEPYEYRSSSGLRILVGKNNIQNEELSFKTASSSDWWFHAKNMPGSHVVVLSDGREPDDRAFEEAASLAAYYSSGSNAPKVDVYYTQQKNLRKVPGAAPGFVTFQTYYSMMASTDISSVERVK